MSCSAIRASSASNVMCDALCRLPPRPRRPALRELISNQQGDPWIDSRCTVIMQGPASHRRRQSLMGIG